MDIKKLHSPEQLSLLIAQVALGNRIAFETLYHATSAKLYAFALRVLNNQAMAEEVIQETFVKVWHSADSYQPEKAGVMTWMTTIVRNRCIDVLRAKPPEEALHDDANFDDWASADLGPMENAASQHETKALMRCMQQLAPLQRQAFALSYFKGLAHEELAAYLVQPLGTVKAWLRRGLATLKVCIGGI
jgi:RNA polymerase sigma-70 factor, ECF subfamily